MSLISLSSSFFSSVGCADDEALTRLFQTSFLFVFWVALPVLKRVKKYIRNSNDQDRSGCLALLWVESDETMKANFDQQIDNFAKLKCRKKVLYMYIVG